MKHEEPSQILTKKRYIFLFLAFLIVISSVAATPLTFPPDTMTVKMYQLNPDNGSSTGKLCNDANNNKTQYGCTAIVNNNDFAYPYASSTPTIPIETDYLLDVVAQEMGPQSHLPQALKVQAIAARTYAYCFINAIENHGTTNPYYSNCYKKSGTINNSSTYQVFVPYKYDTLSGADQQAIQRAVNGMQYITDADNEAVGPIFAEFSTDAYLKTKAGDYDYLKSVPDPISYDPAILNIITATGAHQRGMSQNGTNRWAHGNSSHLGTSTDWSVRWDEAAQILTHYYTGIHLRDAANNDQQLTPDYRWNLLDVSWAEAGCPDIIPENGVCTGTFLIQNTGVAAWNSGRIFFDHYTLAEQANRTTNALINPTGINATALPGEVVTVTAAISPPAGAATGSRQTIRFDMAYAENDTVNYFSEREPGRPWYTYDVKSCVGYCATYLPLVMKNYFSLTLPFDTATDLNYFSPHPDKPTPVSTLRTVNPDTIFPASRVANDGHLTPNGAMKLHHSWVSGSGEGYADWVFDVQERYGSVLAGTTDFSVSVKVGGGWGRDRSSIIVCFTDGTYVRSDYNLGDYWNRRWIKRSGEQGFYVSNNNPSSDGWGPYKNKYLDRIVLRLQFSDQSDDVYVDDFGLTVSP